MKSRVAVGLLAGVLLASVLIGCPGSGGGLFNSQPVIRIYSELAPGQLSESTTITLGGATATLHLDQWNPSGYVEFVGDVAGDYPTRFTSSMVILSNGVPTTFYGVGEGVVHTTGGRLDFQLMIDPTTSPATVYLQNR